MAMYVVTLARCEGNLYQMTFTEVCERMRPTSCVHVREAVGWSFGQLQHLDVRNVYAIQSMVRDMNLGKISCPTSRLVCKACTEGRKYAAKLGNDAEKQATKPLEIVHLGVYGPMRNTSADWAKYFVTFVDDFSKRVWVYMKKSKR